MDDLTKEIWNIATGIELVPNCSCWRYEQIEKTPAGGFWGYVRNANDLHPDDKWKFHWKFCPDCGKPSQKLDDSF